MAFNLNNALASINIAEDLDDQELDFIGHRLKELVDNDDVSRQEWLSDQDEWLKLASQVRDIKNYPWERASNVKYPLLTLAALQFHARALPGLINSNTPVQAKVIGQDYDMNKLRRASRVKRWMSYQVLDQMEEWMDEMDRMMFVLPIIGMCFKKTYFSDNLQRIRSVMVMPRDLILNYHANDYKRARISHVMLMDQNELRELQLQGVFRDIELSAEHKNIPGVRDETLGLSNSGDMQEDPYEVVESHCWWDLDEDGYKEPYIITYHRDSGKVLRIVARWDENGIEYGSKGKIAKIHATEYFTPFIFFPDPNSNVYGIGFGRLLGPTNETANTLINQLVDSGTLSNLQSGFLSRGAGLKSGSTRFSPGEWKIVNASGDNLKNAIVPMPVREPSSTLMNLLTFLVDAGQRISSVTDIMTGENPGQNQPASTTMAVLEQGLKVFTGIYKRIHRQLASEYRKIYALNYRYLDEQMYQAVLDEGVIPPEIPPGASPEEAQMMIMQAQQNPQNIATINDFSPEGLDIIPASDPNFVSDAQRAVKAQSLLEKLGMGLPVNPMIVTKKVLEAEGHEDVEQLMTLPPPTPSLEEKEFELETIKTQIEAFRAYFESLEKVAKAEAAEAGTQLETYRSVVDDKLKVMGFEREGQQAQAENERKERELKTKESKASASK